MTAENADGPAQAPAPSGLSAVIGGTVGSKTKWKWIQGPTGTRLIALTVKRIPIGGSVELTCQGRGCPFRAKKVNLTPQPTACRRRPCKRIGAALRAQVTLTFPFGHALVRPGTVLGTRVTKPGWATRASRFTVRAKGEEEGVDACLVPGVPRAVSCPS